MRKLKLRVVQSSVRPDLLSVRLRENGTSALSLRAGLVEAGFKDGDHAILITEGEYQDLLEIANRHCPHGFNPNDCMNCSKDY